jgi:hypothetical protein
VNECAISAASDMSTRNTYMDVEKERVFVVVYELAERGVRSVDREVADMPSRTGG